MRSVENEMHIESVTGLYTNQIYQNGIKNEGRIKQLAVKLLSCCSSFFCFGEKLRKSNCKLFMNGHSCVCCNHYNKKQRMSGIIFIFRFVQMFHSILTALDYKLIKGNIMLYSKFFQFFNKCIRHTNSFIGRCRLFNFKQCSHSLRIIL